jgi:hypothetical protein
MKIETLEIAGFIGCLESLRLPYKLQPRSIVTYNNFSEPTEFEGEIRFCSSSNIMMHPKDLKLLQALIKKGDEHAKVLRGIEVWVKIDMPLYFMVEFDTYRIGIDTLSTSSSMHTDCKGLEGKELQEVKGEIKGSYIYERVFKVTYQTLRRIYLQRDNHRLPDWQEFCDWIKTLPLANELILIE